MLPRRRSLSGIFLALLALAAQFAVATAVPQIVVAAEPVNHGGRLICYDDADDEDDGGIPAPSHRHDPSECAICPLCLSLAGQSATLISDGPVLPRPQSVLISRAAPLPPSLAPPVASRRSAQPRAPPFPA
jgi:hypothetical protein